MLLEIKSFVRICGASSAPSTFTPKSVQAFKIANLNNYNNKYKLNQ